MCYRHLWEENVPVGCLLSEGDARRWCARMLFPSVFTVMRFKTFHFANQKRDDHAAVSF